MACKISMDTGEKWAEEKGMKCKTMKKKIDVLEQAFAASAGAYYNINLTKDCVPGLMYQVIDGTSYIINEKIGLPKNAKFSEVVSYWGKQLAAEERPAYFDFLDISHLLTRFHAGETHVFHRYWTKTALFAPMLAEQHIAMYTDEETGDVLAITYVLDMTQNYREEQYKKELEENNKKLNEEKRLLEALGADYTAEYICDFDTDRMAPIKQVQGSNAQILNQELQDDKFVFSKRIAHYYETFVHKETSPDFLEKISIPFLKKYLSKHNRFIYRYRAVPNPDGKEYFEIQVVRLPNTKTFQVVFGYRYIDDLIAEEEKQRKRLEIDNAKLEEQIHIISGLTNAYIAVYRVDIENEKFKAVKDIDLFSKAVQGCHTVDEVVETFVTLCVQPEDREKMRSFTDWRQLPNALQDTNTLVMEFHGTVTPWEWCRASWIVASRDEKGKVKEVLFSVEDVTAHVLERKRREQERKREDKRIQMQMKTTAEAIHGGFKVSKNDGYCTFRMVSEQLAQMLGYDSPAELMHRYPTLESIMHPDDIEREYTKIAPKLLSGELYTMHYRAHCKDGSWKNVEDKGRLIYKSNGEGECWSFITDQDELTKKTKALEAAHRVNAALAEARNELETARDQAMAASNAKTAFLFNMSHDIRTPMNAIIGYTELLKKHLENKEKMQDYVGKIEISSEYLLSLINNVLEMARIESGKALLDEAPEPCRKVIDTISTVYAEQLKKKNIHFTTDIDIKTKYIYCDHLKMEEIFLNLLSNAYKYTPEGGSISISVRELPCAVPGYACMQTRISDTGIGMTQEYLPKLFEEFTREHTSIGNTIQGTGLGMSIVKKLVDLMGGTIEVESELGKGTTFIVTITHRIAHGADLHPETSTPVDTAQFVGKRVLLAEDNDLNAEIAMELLKDKGFLVERATDGVICIDMLQRENPGYYDVILMDVQMPSLNGYMATRKIRAMTDPKKRNIPIIAMTANAFEEDRQNALKAGMNEHLGKPVDVDVFMKKLVGVIKESSR